jgi:hypothetical protein
MPDKLMIDDAGEFIPHARKHDAVSTGSQLQRGLRLVDLFPEPDWASMIAAGRPADCVAHLAVLYESLPPAPKAAGVFHVSGRVWERGYVEATESLRQFFSEAKTLTQAKDVAKWMAARFNETPSSILKRSVVEVASYWAASPGGKRRMRPLGSFTLRQQQLASWMHLLGWPQSDGPIRTNISPALTPSGTYLVIEVTGQKYRTIASGIRSTSQAIERARQEIARVSDASVHAGKRRSSATVERLGPHLDPQGSECPEALMTMFRLRGIQFGESLSQIERQRWLRDLHAGLCDLHAILSMPHRWLGLGGIAVAAGARGKGAASAHYEPTLRVVNFTRANGAGSLAHEWWHALDHRLARKLRTASLIETLALAANTGGTRSFPRVHDELLDRVCPIFLELRAALQASEMMRQARRIEALPRARKGYWVSMSEMSARGFEAWIEDQLAKRGQRSPYLVYGTLPEDTVVDLSLSMYPHGVERRALGLLYSELIAVLCPSLPTTAARA